MGGGDLGRNRAPPHAAVGRVQGFWRFQERYVTHTRRIGTHCGAGTDGGVPEGDAKELPEIKIPDPPPFEHPKGELVASGDFALTKSFTLDGLWPRKIPEKTSIRISAELPDGEVELLLWLDEYKNQFGHPFLFQTPLKLPHADRNSRHSRWCEHCAKAVTPNGGARAAEMTR